VFCVRRGAWRAVKLPTSHGATLNLAKMYREVCSRGGYNNVRSTPRRSRFRPPTHPALAHTHASPRRAPQPARSALRHTQRYALISALSPACLSHNNALTTTTQVMECKLWKPITQAFNLPPTATSSSTQFRLHYEKLLLSYEDRCAAHITPCHVMSRVISIIRACLMCLFRVQVFQRAAAARRAAPTARRGQQRRRRRGGGQQRRRRERDAEAHRV
jgi:hypothetical protein